MRTVTFYSYKGGTGRTLLLANLAVLAARLGKKVVALDFDLEAPGLSYKLLPGGMPQADGLVGWLRDAFARGTLPESLDGYLVDVPTTKPLTDGGWLKLLPAGRAPSPTYFKDLRRLNLDDGLREGSALDTLVDLQRAIEFDLGADLLLVDARTGITSTNVVTTHILADEVVALALDTPEQLEGTRAVLRALEPTSSLRTDKPVILHLVLSRVAPKPSGASRFELTEAEKGQIDRVLSYLTEPAEVPRYTLETKRVHLVHADSEVARREFLSFSSSGPWTRTPFHVDQWRIAASVLGPDVTEPASRLIDQAPDPARLEELVHLFAATDRLLEVAGARARQQETGDIGEMAGLGLEEQVLALRAQVDQDATVEPELARRLHVVANRLSQLGRRDEALAPLEEAVAIHRGLADANPASFLPDLAGSLNDLAVCLGETGRRHEALAAISEATELYRQLAEANPSAHLPELATALSNLSADLGEMARHEEGLAASEEAVEIRRSLTTSNPDVHLPALASSLNNLSLLLARTGRREEGLAAIEEATEAYRKLTAADAVAHLPRLAASLNNLSLGLGSMGRRDEALAAIKEAVEIRRRLAEADPIEHLPGLAGSLINLSGELVNTGRPDDGLAAVEEAVDTYRRLAAAKPTFYLPDLAGSLNNLSAILGDLGRPLEALAAIQEAVSIRRSLAETNPAAYLPDLAGSISNLSILFGAADRKQEGLNAIEEAAGLYRRLAEVKSAAYLPDLAIALSGLSAYLGTLGRQEEGLTAIEEAVEILRRLALASPAAFLPDLASSLKELSKRLAGLGLNEKALPPASEATAIYRELTVVDRSFLPSLADSIEHLAMRLADAGEERAAGVLRLEVDRIRRALLAPPDPG